MRIFRALVISALSIPFLVFVIFAGVAFVFMIAILVKKGEYDEGWLGIVLAGAVYGYFALLLSSIPTMVFGWPASVIAERHGYLNKKVILSGSTVLGGVFLGIVGVLLFKSLDAQLVLWMVLAGTLGGFVNRVVFLRYLKPNNSFNPDANSAAHHLRRLS